MDDRHDFDRLVERARDEQAPHVDVTHRVLQSIAAPRGAALDARTDSRSTRVEQRPLLVCAAGALLAASVIAMLAAHSWVSLDDPLADLLAGLAVLNP